MIGFLLLPDGDVRMIPVGVTCSYQERNHLFRLKAAYCRAVEKAGGLPVLLATLKVTGVADYLNMIGGLLLSGGGDVDPRHFGEEPLPGCGEITPQRDEVEIALVRLALQRDMPVLAVCRGLQVLNIACGGDIYQDLALREEPCLQHWQRAPDHYPTHSVCLEAGSVLKGILSERESVRVNTFHHQAVRKPGDGLQSVARSPDGVIEALEMQERAFVLGVQWHPEALSLGGMEGGQELFHAFLQAANRYWSRNH
ncbi:MAG: gamma-glutamyl-gamma-aminobutyrate hydrolase family protein [Bacillota bacterium]